jgi:TPR repeat protein
MKAAYLLFSFFFCTVAPQMANASQCLENPSSCNNKSLCFWAATLRGDWDKGHPKHVALAKARGLNCKNPSSLKSVRTMPTALQVAFTSRNLEERKLIQEKLSQNLMYASSIDGLFGKKTEQALKDYGRRFLKDAPLNNAENARATIEHILSAPNELAGMNHVAPVQKGIMAVPIKTPKPSIKTVKDAFSAGNFKVAMEAAELLAVQGDAEAQYHLGLLFRDGLGTLQLSKTAHMWFNIASISGHQEAALARDALTVEIGQTSTLEAQEMAFQCIQSRLQDCGFTIAGQAIPTPIVREPVNLRLSFEAEPRLRRQQLQYALRHLGYYSGNTDGVWGGGTERALNAFLQASGSKPETAVSLFDEVLSRVVVPRHFPQTNNSKPRATELPKANDNRQTNTGGLVAIVANPTLPGAQALAVCQPQADMARSGNYSDGISAYNCTGFGNTLNCRQDGWSQLGDALAGAITARTMAKKVLASCLAQYGWRKP